MENKRAIWVVVAIIGFIVVFILAQKVAPRPKVKTRPSRIANVNRVNSVAPVMTNTNPPPQPEPVRSWI